MKRPTIPKSLIVVFTSAEGLLYLAFLLLDVSGRGGETLWLKYTGILLCLIFAAFCALCGGERLVAPALLLTAGKRGTALVTEAIAVVIYCGAFSTYHIGQLLSG